VSQSSAASFPRRQRGVSDSESVVYVHLMSGEVATISPATNVVVEPDMVLVYDGETPVAEYPRRNVFSCSLREISPSFT
jgi:hypothetical protein